jgi:hypothetical protein
MTENDNQILTREWLARKVEADKAVAAEAAQERAVEETRAAWIEETGVEPTASEVKQVLAVKRQEDAAERARRNQMIATHQALQNF